MKKKLTALLLCCALACTTACGGSSDNTGNVSETVTSGTLTEENNPEASAEITDLEESDENDPEEKLIFDLMDYADPASFTGEGMKTAFIRNPEFGEKITDADIASMAIYNNLDLMGAEGPIVLQYANTRPTETGITYYTFNQVDNYVRVYGSSVKLIADKEGNAIGLVSAIIPNINIPNDLQLGATADEAEVIVKERFRSQGIYIIPGATEEVLLPAAEGYSTMYYAWVVYSRSSGGKTDAAFTAHYVSKAGNYLYSLPVSDPRSMDAAKGSVAAFAFDGGKEGVLNTTLSYSDGSAVEVSLPVMIDRETGQTLLADPERKILCADYADFMNHDTLTPVKCGENDPLVNSQLMDYYHFILVYDFFEEIGWTGPDGEGTPSLLLMNMVDENGEPEDNAYYQGALRGFQVFNFSDINDYGETLDVMAHEFTHCFTSTVMTENIYLNDAGAINEGMSDIIGNLVDIMINGYTDDTWLIGDPSNIHRSMSDPHRYEQPEYVGDRFYQPAVPAGSDSNDNGGVHINSSLLNQLSWYLDRAGMEPSDQIYFWMNVALAMTPYTDYPQMAVLLPWVLETSGYPQYISALEDAIQKTRIGLGEDPQDVPEGCGKVRFIYEFNELQNYEIQAAFVHLDEDEDSIITWPSAATNWVSAAIPPGVYAVTLIFTKYADNVETDAEPGEEEEDIIALYTENGWTMFGDDEFEQTLQEYAAVIPVKVEEGRVLNLETETLASLIEER
ncbi:MAG: M4 family metallopeptidase [Eubacterium sp.]|nr:M4 family metallopeptidase [Eubacterium sp.]